MALLEKSAPSEVQETKVLRDISTRLGKKESALRDCLYRVLFNAVVGKNETGPLNVLDIGCGRGELLMVLKEKGHSAFGVDVEQDCVELCQRYADVKQGGFQDVPRLFSDRTIDVVVSSHVLEHVDNPLDCLTKARELNAQRYIFAVPNVHRSIRLLRAIASSNRPDHPTHVFGWGRPEFQAILRRAGYDFIRWHSDRVTVNPFAGRMGVWLTHVLGPLETRLFPRIFPGLSSSLIAECSITKPKK